MKEKPWMESIKDPTEYYQPPCLEVWEVCVERGFAGSGLSSSVTAPDFEDEIVYN